MQKTIFAAAIALAMVVGAGGGMMIAGAGAQPAPPPAGFGGPPPPPPPGGPHAMHGPGGWRGAARNFALIYRPEDRKLGAPDVQKIAESLLLWNGNRSWKVTDVAEAPDNKIAFTYATQDGSPVAKFTMDRKTGRLERVG